MYEKHKNAALEVEGIVKQLAVAGDHDKITAVINLLTNEFTYSAEANHRKLYKAVLSNKRNGDRLNGAIWQSILNAKGSHHMHIMQETYEGMEKCLHPRMKTWMETLLHVSIQSLDGVTSPCLHILDGEATWYGRPLIKSFQSLLRNTSLGKIFFKAVATPDSLKN
ncbi:unnamed protein product [Fraxinus pennsylvanica]|uniref:Uncharacterized protein n=1 Tax=Fraxinus pennsylvanica TaxID=56036 RepID=A0AAD1Z4M5_9LAMI|nr:unnamed protein product [Fraxinus pennsylvanica]